MAITYRTITGNLADLLRTDFDPASVRVTVRTNLADGDAPVDLTNGQILLGTGRVTIASDGTFSTTNVIDHASTDVNPTGIQYRWDIDFTPRNAQRATSWSSGFVSVTADANLATLVEEQYVPPTYQSAFIAQAEELLAQQEAIAGLATSDAAQAYNVENGPLTGAALSATIEDTAAAVAEVTPAYQGIRPAWDPPMSRVGSFAGLSRWLRAMTVKPISGTAGLTIVTDSTGTDTSAGDGPGWPSRLAASLAALGDITVRFRYFDHSGTLKMRPPTVLHESTLGRPKYGIGSNPSNFLTAPNGRSGLAPAGTLFTSDPDLRRKIDAKLADINGQTIELVCNYGPGTSAAERGIEFYIGSTQTLSIRTAVGGSSYTFNSTVALTWVDDVPIWLRATLTKDNGASGKTARFYYSTDEQATWTQLGSDVTQAGVLGAMNSPAWYWELGTRGGGLTWNLVLTGSPTGGSFTIKFFPDNASNVIDTTMQTAAIPWNADAAAVQAAIRAVTGHAAFATAVVTGTNPSFVISFPAIPVRYAQTTNSLTGGTTPGAALGGAWGIRKFNDYEVEIRNGIDGPIYGPTNVWDWDTSPSRVGYSGGPMLDVVNFAFSGRALPNFNATPYKDVSTANRSTLALILATGHNEGTVKGSELVTLLDTFRTNVEARLPNAAIAVLTENPQVSPSVVDQFQAIRASQIAAYAARNGWSVIDTFIAFLDDPRWVNSDGGDLLNDDRHPSTLAHQTIIEPLVRRAIETGA